MDRKKVLRTLAVCCAGVALASCSMNRLAVRAVSGMLAGGGQASAFMTDDDPELVGDALPFSLKLFEILLESEPSDSALLLATGQGFVSYASAFVQAPADELPLDKLDRQLAQRARAKKLYLRGRAYVMRGLEARRPGFRAALEGQGAPAALALVKPEDIDFLYWAGISALAAFSAEPFDVSLMVSVPRNLALLERVAGWNDAYGKGAVHEAFISFYGSAPPELGGSEAKARESFRRVVQISGATRAGPYVALASTVCVRNQERDEFRRQLQAALAVDLNADPSARLENVIQQRKARWLLDNADALFVEGGDSK